MNIVLAILSLPIELNNSNLIYTIFYIRIYYIVLIILVYYYYYYLINNTNRHFRFVAIATLIVLITIFIYAVENHCLSNNYVFPIVYDDYEIYGPNNVLFMFTIAIIQIVAYFEIKIRLVKYIIKK
jgi:hypothetical protein